MPLSGPAPSDRSRPTQPPAPSFPGPTHSGFARGGAPSLAGSARPRPAPLRSGGGVAAAPTAGPGPPRGSPAPAPAPAPQRGGPQPSAPRRRQQPARPLFRPRNRGIAARGGGSPASRTPERAGSGQRWAGEPSARSPYLQREPGNYTRRPGTRGPGAESTIFVEGSAGSRRPAAGRPGERRHRPRWRRGRGVPPCHLWAAGAARRGAGAAGTAGAALSLNGAGGSPPRCTRAAGRGTSRPGSARPPRSPPSGPQRRAFACGNPTPLPPHRSRSVLGSRASPGGTRCAQRARRAVWARGALPLTDASGGCAAGTFAHSAVRGGLKTMLWVARRTRVGVGWRADDNKFDARDWNCF